MLIAKAPNALNYGLVSLRFRFVPALHAGKDLPGLWKHVLALPWSLTPRPEIETDCMLMQTCRPVQPSCLGVVFVL